MDIWSCKQKLEHVTDLLRVECELKEDPASFRPAGYMLAKCVSAYATPWFVTKKGKPDPVTGIYKQIRAVCNYVWLNEYVVVEQFPLKNIPHTLTHISGSRSLPP